ncbi:MAG: hypothetical protein ACD_75C00219G0001, partial [uncultured bacterium]
MTENSIDRFIESAKRVGAEVLRIENLPEAAAYIAGKAQGTTLVPETPLAVRHGLRALLAAAGVDVF